MPVDASNLPDKVRAGPESCDRVFGGVLERGVNARALLIVEHDPLAQVVALHLVATRFVGGDLPVEDFMHGRCSAQPSLPPA